MLEGPIGGASFNNEFGRPNIGGYFRTFEMEVDDEIRGYHKPIMLAGGIGNIRGALVGGFAIGMIRVYSDTYLAAEWTRSVIFAVLILVLVFFPSGLVGSTTTVEKA